MSHATRRSTPSTDSKIAAAQHGFQLLGLLVLISLYSAVSRAETLNSQTLSIIRAEGNWPPYEMQQQGTLAGFHIDLIRNVAAQQGIPITFQSVPWRRAIHMLHKGEADAIAYFSWSKERQEFAYFFPGNVLSHAQMVLFSEPQLAQRLTPLTDFKALLPFVVGTVRGFHYGEAFNRVQGLSKTGLAASEEQLLKQFMGGRFLIGAGERKIVTYWATQFGIQDRVHFIEPALTPLRENYLAFSKARNKRALAKRFSQHMLSYKSGAEYRALVEHYELDPTP